MSGIYHEWNGTVLTITSDSGTSSADLKGDDGCRGAQGAPGIIIGGGANLVGKKTEQNGEIFNFYDEVIYTGDEPPKEFPGNTANKGSHAEGFSTDATGEYAHAEGWNSVASGGIAHAQGRETEAIGYASHAEGHATVASGRCAHAEGNEAKATADYSHAEGQLTEANEMYSHAEGYKSKANGAVSHAEGRETETNGDSAHAEGRKTKATGIYSHAEGNETVASGGKSHAEGQKTTASNTSSHAEGEETVASGYASHAQGYKTQATGTASHAEGRETIASEYAAHAEGRGTIANSRNQHAQGKYNVADTPDSNGNGTYAHIVGGGSSDTDRYNIYTLDWNGNAEFAGNVIANGKELVTTTDVTTITSKLYAPKGYGLGEESGYYVTDCNDAKKSGFYITGTDAANNPQHLGESVGMGEIFVKARGQRIQQIYGVVINDSYISLQRHSIDYGRTWGEWEWVNPLMQEGVEYRTIERYNGKPVYKQLVSLGALANNSNTCTFMNSTQFKTQKFNVISIEPSFKEVNADGEIQASYCGLIRGVTNIFAKQNVIGIAEIYCYTNQDMSSYNGYAVVSYTMV